MDGMLVKTDTERVRKNRKTALELLLSDHDGDCRPPCLQACPAGTDCQGYAQLIALGRYGDAVRLIKERLPLPASIGRVCPHPCEDKCRRELVEEPVSLAFLKYFAADIDLNGDSPYMPNIAESTGKRVAVVGGGPGGLTAAYYLRTMGHGVTVMDALPLMGGMLRYGIPEYRLPKAILDKEIGIIAEMGVEMKNNVRLGTDVSLDELRKNYDAVLVAVGAWKSSPMRCKGEDLNGVYGGIDFLLDVAQQGELTRRFKGKNVAVVGGGNVAMDCCRTLVRLGAQNVYNIYRRTRNEMPAEEIEIIEAEEEGVIFKNLTNPNEIEGGDGVVKRVRLQIMELGEPDASGRRAPVPVEGKEEVLEVDAVFAAIGNKTVMDGLDGIAATKWGTIQADGHTFATNIQGVFAVGDAVNDGAGIAITAIGQAGTAAKAIDTYLRSGEMAGTNPPPYVERTVSKDDYKDKVTSARARMPHMPPEVRKTNFEQVNFGFSQETARKEAERCLDCGCQDYFNCKLIKYAAENGADPKRYGGAKHTRGSDERHESIILNPDKCVLCGLCMRVCEEVEKITALGLVGRGFDTVMLPAVGRSLMEAGCNDCGKCAQVCPTGAVMKKGDKYYLDKVNVC
jgi:formate dehydrogenase major subunit